MLNLNLLIAYNRESLTDKLTESIPETTYQTIFEACERFLYKIKTEYKTVFEYIKISSEEKISLDNINSKLKMFLFNVAASLPRRSYAKKNDIFDSLIIDEEDDQFTRFSLKNVLSLTYELELHYKEYMKNCLKFEKSFIKRPLMDKLGNSSFIDSFIEYNDKVHINHQNFTSLSRNKNNNAIFEEKMNTDNQKSFSKRSKSFDSHFSEQDRDFHLDLQFCENLIENYNQLLKQCNYTCMKQLRQNGHTKLVQAIENYLDNLYEDELFTYIKNRISITQTITKLIEELKLKSFNAYTDKLLKPCNDSNTIRKSSTYSDVKNYNRADTNKLSLYLSKIRSLPFSHDNYSLMEEIQVILKDKKKASDHNIEDMEKYGLFKTRKNSETTDINNQGEIEQLSKVNFNNEEVPNNLYRCYCTIF